MTNYYSLIPLVFGFFVTVSSILALWRALSSLRKFDSALAGLPRDVAQPGSFDEGNDLGKAANEYLALFALCAQKQVLGSFSVTNSVAPVQARIRMLTSQPRNLTGVIILCGLLVTLFNLQGSVGVLGQAFDNLSTGQSSSGPLRAEQDVKLIQRSMGQIAQTAKSAFVFSGIVILAAAVILWCALMVQRVGHASMLRFATWANAAYLEALAARPVDQQALIQKFGEMIEGMGQMMSTFELAAASMSSAGDLGSKLDESSRIVAEAVSHNPASINDSVVKLSAEVTKDISVHLQHQIEHLKKILAIYGDQEGRVTKIQVCLDSFSASMEASVSAVAGLKSLPEKLDALSGTIAASTKGASSIESAAKTLSRKVDQLPVIQFQEVLTEISAMKDSLPITVGKTVDVALAGFEKRLATASSSEQIVGELKKLRSIVEGLPEQVDQTQLRNLVTKLEALIAEAGRPKGLFDIFRGR